MVAQRMSLVAFGSLSPPISEDNLTNSAIEEPVEGEPEPPALSHFLGTSLSTIKESPSSRGDQSTSAEVASPLPAMQFTTLAEAPVDDRTSGRCQPRTPRSSEDRSRTIYFTPTSSPVRQSNGLPLPMESPFLPPRHHSAPPLAVTVALLNGHSEHTSSLQNELRQSRAVVDALNSDLQHDRDIIKEQEQDIARYIEHLRQKDSCIGKLEERFAESVEASTGLREESCVQKKSE